MLGVIAHKLPEANDFSLDRFYFENIAMHIVLGIEILQERHVYLVSLHFEN